MNYECFVEYFLLGKGCSISDKKYVITVATGLDSLVANGIDESGERYARALMHFSFSFFFLAKSAAPCIHQTLATVWPASVS